MDSTGQKIARKLHEQLRLADQVFYDPEKFAALIDSELAQKYVDRELYRAALDEWNKDQDRLAELARERDALENNLSKLEQIHAIAGAADVLDHGALVAALDEIFLKCEEAYYDPQQVTTSELVEALNGLTTLIRNMADVYGAEQAKWLISKPTFQNAEECAARLWKLRG